MAQYTQINPEALVTALTPINDSINEINTKIGNLTGALVWKGKFDTLPAVTDYEAGNVVGVGNKEYVLTVTGSTKTWEELGDEGSYLLKSVAEETYAKKTDIPTVPEINNPKVSVKMNGTEKGSFTLNQATDGEVDLGTVLTEHQSLKTINGKTITGSGNIEISASSITADTSMSNTSTNPVQNKVIKAYIDNILGTISTQLAAI